MIVALELTVPLPEMVVFISVAQAGFKRNMNLNS